MKIPKLTKTHGNLITGLALAVLLLLSILLYRIYVTHTLRIIEIFKTEDANISESVNTDLYNSIVKQLEKKKEPLPALNSRNPFKN